MSKPEMVGVDKGIGPFLSHLAVERNATRGTQATALNTLIFLYRELLGQPTEGIDFKYAHNQPKISVVFTHKEAIAVITILPPLTVWWPN